MNVLKTVPDKRSKASVITLEERNKMIAEAAFYIAEQRGFTGDCRLHDWLEADAKIARIYGKAESA